MFTKCNSNKMCAWHSVTHLIPLWVTFTISSYLTLSSRTDQTLKAGSRCFVLHESGLLDDLYKMLAAPLWNNTENMQIIRCILFSIFEMNLGLLLKLLSVQSTRWNLSYDNLEVSSSVNTSTDWYALISVPSNWKCEIICEVHKWTMHAQ